MDLDPTDPAVKGRRLVVGWPPYLPILKRALTRRNIVFAVECSAPDKRTLVFEADDLNYGLALAIARPEIDRIRKGE